MKIILKNIIIGEKELNLRFDLKNSKCIVGPNGAGKTTILRILSATFIPEKGIIIIDGNEYNFAVYKDREELRIWAEKNVYYLEDENLFMDDTTTIYQNFKYYSLLNSLSKEYFLTLFKEFNINEDINKQIKYLSSGTKKKLAIIFALMSDKKIILFDEPLNFLDSKTKSHFINFIKSSEKIFIISTHEKEYISKMDRLEVN